MKVMCIDDNEIWIGETPAATPSVVVYGGVYNVVDEQMCSDGLYYELSEDVGYLYEAKSFIPLSDIDETELVKERELVC